MVLGEVEYNKGVGLGHEVNFPCLLGQLSLRAIHKPK